MTSYVTKICLFILLGLASCQHNAKPNSSNQSNRTTAGRYTRTSQAWTRRRRRYYCALKARYIAKHPLQLVERKELRRLCERILLNVFCACFLVEGSPDLLPHPEQVRSKICASPTHIQSPNTGPFSVPSPRLKAQLRSRRNAVGTPTKSPPKK